MATNSTNITNTGIKTSFSNTPQAMDDAYSLTEAGLQSNSYSGVSYNDVTHILTLDVMSNDLGGGAKTLFAIDDGNGHTNLTDYDLLTKDTAGVWEASANGNRIQIADGKINVDISHFLQSVGVASIDALGAGDRIQDEFVYSIRLANGALSQAKVTIDIQGSNDLAAITGNHAGSVTEDTQLTASGALTVTDVDRGENHAQAGTGATALGSYSVDANGQWSYSVDNAAVQHLAAGQTTTDSFVVKSADGTATQTVSITINGTNDAASISGQATGTLGEDDTAAVNGTLAVTDVDDGQAHAVAASGNAALGSYSVDADGHWSYTVDNAAVQHLAAGATATDSFVVTSADGTATQTVSITINGANDAASISGDASGALGEDDVAAVTGAVAVSDVDDGQAHAVAASGNVALGSYSVDADGHWSYTVDNAAVQHLAAGQSTTDSFVIASADGTASQTVTVTINGVNDAASIAGDTSGALGEDDIAAVTGTLVVSDVDDGEAHAAAAAGATALGSYSVGADGQWSYAVNNEAVQHLAAGQSTTDSFVVKSADGTAAQTVSITINGVNDAASMSGDTSGAVGEDDTLAVTGAFAVSDVDDGEAHAAAATGATALGSYSINADGQWAYTVDNAAVQHLAAGQTASDSFVVHSLDGTATETVSITINGTNDQASISGQTSGSVGEDDTSAISGLVTIADADDGEAHALAATGSTALGSYSIDANGHWTYAVDNAAVQSLNAGDTLTDSFTVHSLDGSAAQTISVTINGADDSVPHVGPVAHDDNWIVSQSTPAVLPLAALFGNDTHAAGASLTLTALSADGINWTGTSGTTTNGATVALNAAGITVNEGNRTADDGFWYQAGDGQGGTATGHVSIGVVAVQNGANGADTVNLSAKSYGYSYIDAGEGGDTVTGGSGIDYLVGGSGADVLTGNGGADILTGGTGNDVFKYSALGDATDTITDFQINKANGNDALDVHDLLASFSGVDAAHSNAYSGGYLQLSQVLNGGKTDTQVWVDADGSGGSGAQVLLATLTNVALTQYDTSNIVL